jgi:hypothetical protein
MEGYHESIIEPLEASSTWETSASHLGSTHYALLCPNNQSCIGTTSSFFFILVHTTHFLQPLDDAVTGAFKNSIKRYKQTQIFSHVLHRETPVAVLQNITEEAANEALKPATIRSAFRNIGLWPFDPSLIRQRTNQALAQPENPRSDSLDDKIVASALMG